MSSLEGLKNNRYLLIFKSGEYWSLSNACTLFLWLYELRHNVDDTQIYVCQIAKSKNPSFDTTRTDCS